MTFSSDLVFCGTHKKPHRESDKVNPLKVYGQTKAEAEKKSSYNLPSALVIRTSAFFGHWDAHNFVTIALQHLLAGELFVSPTYVPDLVNTSLDLLIDGKHGLWHLSNHTEVSWADLAMMAVDMKGLNTKLIIASQSSELPYTATRPSYSVLGTERCKIMPDLEQALTRYLQEAKIPALI